MENITPFGGTDNLKVGSGPPSNDYQDINLNALENAATEEASVFHGIGTVPESIQQLPPNVNANPMSRQAYSMPAAGMQRATDQGSLSPIRKYNMSSDIFGTGMDKSWAGGAPPPSGMPINPLIVNRNEPASFKITQQANSSAVDDNANSSVSGTRKARESSGNPLTGQGYDNDNSKTAKRYFEGSNANQKLW